MPFLQSSDPTASLDVEIFLTGDRSPVICGPGLRAAGWRGGVWVMYVPGDMDFTVERSDGTRATGFLLFPSEGADPSTVGGSSDFISYQPATGVGGQNVMTMVNGGTRAYFKVFETVALAGGARVGGPLVYNLNDDLKVSENGLLCNDPDAQFALIGITTPIVVGMVSAVPSPRNFNRLGLDLKF